MKYGWSVIIILLAAFIPMAGLIAAIFGDRKLRKKSEKPPQTEKLLRPPGHSLSIRLDKTLDTILDNIGMACCLSAFAGACVATFRLLIVAKAPMSWFFACLVVFAVFTILSIRSAIRAFSGYLEGRNIRLGLRGEQAVAEALNETAIGGFRAFHDLADEKIGNIDHVAVGTRGVFVIETKARRRRASRNEQPAHEVVYDGETLQFPNSTETKPLEQIKTNAKWLSNYLGKKTGEPVRVEPLIVLPGWFVRNSQRGDFPVKVMNANYLVRFLQGRPEIIPVAQVRRLITTLDEKCRDVEF